MRMRRMALWTALALLAVAPCGWAGEVDVKALIQEFLEQTPAVERTPAQLEAAYSQVLDSFLPQMGSENPGERQGPEQTFQEICWKAGRPGADASRLAVCKAIVSRLGKNPPKMARVWLLKQLEHIGSAEAVDCLAGILKDQDKLVRERARRALQNNRSEEATPVLVAALGSAKEPSWRVGLLNALGYRNDPRALKPLIAQAGDDNDDVRTAAAKALARLGDKAALDVIAAGMTQGSDRAKRAAADAYLLLADQIVARGDKATALGIYRKLLAASGHIRCAAIIGIGRAGGLKELDTIFAALGDPDARVRGAALAALGLLPAREVTQAMIARMKSASPEMKVVLLRALAQGADKDSLPAFLEAAKDANQAVRVAAYEGMGELRNEAAAPVLVAAVAGKEGDELSAAKAAVNRIPGDAVTQALIAALGDAPASGRVELIQCLAARRSPPTVPALLKSAQDPDAAVRTEALKAVADLADEKAVPDLVRLLVSAKESRERDAAERTLVAVCKRSDDVEGRAKPVLAALAAASVPARVSLLRVLGRLGGDGALKAVRTGLKDPSAEVQDAAFRALPSWATLEVANDLLDMAKSDAELARRVLALRGAVDVAGKLSDQPAAEILKLYERAMAAAARPEDKKMVLGGMGSMANLGALELAERYLADPALKAEAEVAVGQIARSLSGSHKDKAREVCQKLIAATKNDRVRNEAKQTIDLIERFEDYITAWLVSGPHTAPGKDGPALLGIAFPPEKPGDTTAAWKPMPVGTTPAQPWLLEFDKTLGGNDRAAYLRTRLYSPKKQEAQMELGSDDGVKLWIGGKLVHENNASRPCSPGQDRKKVALEEGWQDLLMKVTQGGGEWSCCLRFRAADGGKLDGVKADPAGQ